VKNSTSGSQAVQRYARGLTGAAAALLCFWANPVEAGTPPTLSFDVIARASKPGGTGAVHSLGAHVLLRGAKARFETNAGGEHVVILWSRPYVYRLLTKSKSGLRYKSATPLPEMPAPTGNWLQLMNSPAAIRLALAAKGAKKTGKTTLDGQAADVYTAKNWQTSMGGVSAVKIWLRHSDALPLRMDSMSGGWRFSIKWSHFVRNSTLAPSLFEVPPGYHIREGRAPQSSF
jgi:hypothetical protein